MAFGPVRAVTARPNRIYQARNGGRVTITTKHPKWAFMYEGFFDQGEMPFVWTDKGKFIHGVGENHPWDLIRDLGMVGFV